MKLKQHETLWFRIRAFPIDDPGATIQFSDKLAFQNNWPPAFTRRAIEEYKKFIFLCCISPTGASPSEVVDEVWHLHLTYTVNYWKEFCGKTLGKEIHHHPSKGGSTEKGKHQNWYAATIELYKDVFEEDPPVDIWQEPVQKSETVYDGTFPELNYKRAYTKHLLILLLPFLLPLFFWTLHPFALDGPQFIVFYILMIICLIIAMVKVYSIKKEMVVELTNEMPVDDASSYQLARFVFGRNKAIQTAIVDLASRRILSADIYGRLRIYPSRYEPHNDRENPLSTALLQNYQEGQRVKPAEIAAYFDDENTHHDKLMNLRRAAESSDPYVKLLFVGLGFIGSARMIQGTANDKPVTYLFILLLLTIFIGIVTTYLTSGRKILQDIFQSRYTSNQLTAPQHEEILLKFVFLGITSLASIYALKHLDSVFRSSAFASVSGSSGCGSSGCGSSCGGGCGGGCGGCGGD